MYLKKFIYVNWGNVPNSEFDFGPINLFSGGNGSGKTTAADAVQTIMTAAHDNLFHFNPGQDESSQRGRGGKQVRTLASYVLGCDDGAYARPYGCDGYIAAVFHPTEGEASEPFTALIGMRASIEGAGAQKIARLEETQFFILPDVALSLGDLLKDDKTQRYVVPLDRIYTSLRRQFGSDNLEKYDKKKAYLCRLYGILRGSKKDAVSEREAMNAARAFSRFMAYKPIKGIDEFVANEVLEQRDLGEAIRTVSAMLKRIHTMESDSRQLREAIARLAQGRAAADSYIANWLELQVLHYSLAKRRYSECQGRYLAEKQQQLALREQLTTNEQALSLNDQRQEDLNQQILDATARRLGVPALRDKDQLQQDKQTQEQQLHQLVPKLLAQDQQLQVNLQAAQAVSHALKQSSIALEVSQLADKYFQKLLKQLVDSHLQIDLHSLLNRDWIDISPLEKMLDEALEQQKQHNQFAAYWLNEDLTAGQSLRDFLAQERDKRQQLVQRLHKQVESKQRDIHSLESDQVVYPHFVRAALELLQQQCPQADARVLCDYVEVSDAQWQAAIEGYLGAARFGIIVAAEYEAEAIRIVRNMPGPGKSARVIQGDKARRDCEKMPAIGNSSIVQVMNFSHSTAEYYVIASYGSVERVSDAAALRNTRRGITKDAMGSGNYAMFRCDIAESELVFGRDARARALEEKRRELEQLTKEWQAASDYANEISLLWRAVNKINQVGYADVLQQMLTAQRRIQSIEIKLQQLDLSDCVNLDEELTQLKQQTQLLGQESQQLNNSRIDIKAKLLNLDEKCRQLNDEQDKTLERVDGCEENVRAISEFWTDFDPEPRLAQADLDAQAQQLSYFEQHLLALQAELKSYNHKLQQAVLQHNQFCRTADGLSLVLDYQDDFGQKNFREICSIRRHFDSLYNRDKNHILAQRHAELEALRLSFNNAFVTNLCHSIYQAIQDGKKVLDELNAELEHHRFGADRERFRFGYDWVPEFKEYWQFFKAIIDNPSLGDGESLFEMKLEPKHQQVRERLMNMLLDEDEQKALRDLTRIADYRNYRRYEIYKEPEGKAPIALSQYGTGSGGQLETPAYIIRSAAITSAFRFNEGNSHLRMVLVDEAFSKMDEHRSREVINYLTESLGLQLLFIMPSSKSGPFMDLISNQFVFSKCPTTEAVGELKSRVLLDRQVCAPEKIKKLMENHRRTIRNQAALDFMAEVDQ